MNIVVVFFIASCQDILLPWFLWFFYYKNLLLNPWLVASQSVSFSWFFPFLVIRFLFCHLPWFEFADIWAFWYSSICLDAFLFYDNYCSEKTRLFIIKNYTNNLPFFMITICSRNTPLLESGCLICFPEFCEWWLNGGINFGLAPMNICDTILCYVGNHLHVNKINIETVITSIKSTTSI